MRFIDIGWKFTSTSLNVGGDIGQSSTLTVHSVNKGKRCTSTGFADIGKICARTGFNAIRDIGQSSILTVVEVNSTIWTFWSWSLFGRRDFTWRC